MFISEVTNLIKFNIIDLELRYFEFIFQFVRFIDDPNDFVGMPMMCFGTPSEVM